MMRIKGYGLLTLLLSLVGALLFQQRENKLLCQELDDVYDELLSVRSDLQTEKQDVETLREEFEQRAYELEEQVSEVRSENTHLLGLVRPVDAPEVGLTQNIRGA